MISYEKEDIIYHFTYMYKPFLIACNKRDGSNVTDINKNDSEISDEEKELIYDVENARGFCIDEDGTLYTLVDNSIKTFDTEGRYIKEYSIEEEFLAPYISILGYKEYCTWNKSADA